ncbi:ATPase PAAT isoform X2 [Syngnathoides biaculeatus]|uniref:ATPase PAAT isoform X2 n=1 Tax=Syngnathoides biaculeatus TaxID=300417 RepID=UPI002ADE495D|nr:ATPase PAAT isoform X2 [Syngnathoides biaculeatus]
MVTIRQKLCEDEDRKSASLNEQFDAGDMSPSVSVTIGAAWQCRTEGRRLVDVVRAVHVTAPDDGDGEEEHKLTERIGDGGVLLERAHGAEAEPCVLTLSCGPAAISRLTLVSEARTMEVYLPTGEYCATVRGDKQDRVRLGDRGPFYRKQLRLDAAPSSCDVKLLSLSGRSNVLLCGALVGLRPPRPPPARDGGAVDLRRVRGLVDEMGASLSPGAQNLMEMLRLQQKAAADSAPDDLVPDEMVRRVLKAGAPPPEMLRKVCGQVTRLRLDRDRTPAADAWMERRLEEMERRLKEHVDRRLDALERKLEKALLGDRARGRPGSPGPDEEARSKVRTNQETEPLVKYDANSI